MRSREEDIGSGRVLGVDPNFSFSQGMSGILLRFVSPTMACFINEIPLRLSSFFLSVRSTGMFQTCYCFILQSGRALFSAVS